MKDNIVKLDELKQEFKAKVERFHALESVVNELEHTVDDVVFTPNAFPAEREVFSQLFINPKFFRHFEEHIQEPYQRLQRCA